MITKEDVKRFETPTLLWEIPLPEGALYPQIEGIFDLQGSPLVIDHNVELVDATLRVTFPLDPATGIALYKYRTDTNVVEDDDNIVNITVNQQSTPSQDPIDHQIINIENTKVIEVENKTAHSRKIRVYQFLEEVDGIKSYQDYTESVDLIYKERVTDGKRFIRIESNFPITGFIELI